MIYLSIDNKGYVEGWSSTRSSDNDVELELDDDHEFFDSDFSCWKYENDELIFDEEKQKQLTEEYEREQNKPSEQKRIEALESALLELILRSDNDD